MGPLHRPPWPLEKSSYVFGLESLDSFPDFFFFFPLRINNMSSAFILF
jgi:hypothetical protein